MGDGQGIRSDGKNNPVSPNLLGLIQAYDEDPELNGVPLAKLIDNFVEIPLEEEGPVFLALRGPVILEKSLISKGRIGETENREERVTLSSFEEGTHLFVIWMDFDAWDVKNKEIKYLAGLNGKAVSYHGYGPG